MPKQYESEKRRLDRQRQAKDLVSNFKAPAPGEDPNESNAANESNDKRIKKALVACYLQV